MMRLFAAVRLLLYVQYELIIANYRVARDVIRPIRYLHPRIIRVPLEEASDAQIAVLASLITLTPGTITVDIADDKRALYVHAMDVQDVEDLRQEIKTGFERRVKEVFE